MLAMLAPKRALCVAVRGSGPGAKRRRPCPPLCAVAGWKCRDEGCPATPTPRGPAGPASNKGWLRGGKAEGVCPLMTDSVPCAPEWRWT